VKILENGRTEYLTFALGIRESDSLGEQWNHGTLSRQGVVPACSYWKW
jgi:hypothetical protein